MKAVKHQLDPKKYAESRQVCGRYLSFFWSAAASRRFSYGRTYSKLNPAVRVRRAPPSFERNYRKVRALWFCLPVCPTYVFVGQEMDSPRGRIYLMKIASEGAAEMNANWVSHFDSCLGCMACMTACPSAWTTENSSRPHAHRSNERQNAPGRKTPSPIHVRDIHSADRLRKMRLPLLVYQKSGLQTVIRESGLLSLLPKKIQAMEALLPKLGRRQAVAEVTPAVGTKRRRVGLLLGCVQREFFSQVNAATARVLAAEGCEVIAPQEQTCCGALLVHAGEETAAVELAKRTIDAFERRERRNGRHQCSRMRLKRERVRASASR